ncbi:MAG: hypothetical protein ACRBBQ_09920 [Cognatishimia sp.]
MAAFELFCAVLLLGTFPFLLVYLFTTALFSLGSLAYPNGRLLGLLLAAVLVSVVYLSEHMIAQLPFSDRIVSAYLVYICHYLASLLPLCLIAKRTEIAWFAKFPILSGGLTAFCGTVILALTILPIPNSSF